MVKQVPKSDKLQRLVAKVTGDENASLDDLAVYEAVFATTQPLRRQSGLYQSAVIGADTMAAAKAKLDAGETIPLALMHRDSLPAGRVLSAELRPGPDGSTQLQGLFYLPRKDSELTNKIDTGVLNEVSVNFTPAQLLCSECGWDYMGADASFENVWSCVCANDHAIGKDGVRAHVHGLKSWNELSLVARGASQNATILPRSKQQLGAPDAARFAELGFDERIFSLRASASDAEPVQTPPENKNMADPSTVELQANLIVATRDLTAATTALTAKDAEIATLKAKVVESDAKIAALSAADAGKLKTDLELADALINELATATLSAVGRGSEKLPETVSDRVALVRDLRSKLAIAIPAGGASQATGTGSEDTNTPNHKPNYAAFKTGS